MKNPIYTAASLSLVTTSVLHAQEFTLPLEQIPSTDGLGNPANVVFEEPVGQVIITNIAWTDVVGDGLGGPTWGNEMAMQINDAGFVNFFPEEGEATAGGVWGPSEGSIDVNIEVENLRLEFFETYDDFAGVDATYVSGLVTITYIPGGDCNDNGIQDDEELSPETDCNSNGRLDECDLADGATDCDANGVLDVCENTEPPTETELAFDTGVLDGGQTVDLSVALGGSLVSLGVQLDYNNADGDGTWAGDLLIQLISPAGDCVEVGGFNLSNCANGVAADFDASWDVEASGAYAFTFPDLGLCNTTEGDWTVQLGHGYDVGTQDQWSGTLTIGTTGDSGPVCPADLDGSGAIDFGDIVQVLSNWGSTGPADLDGSGIVDFGDLIAVLSSFGPC